MRKQRNMIACTIFISLLLMLAPVTMSAEEAVVQPLLNLALPQTPPPSIQPDIQQMPIIQAPAPVATAPTNAPAQPIDPLSPPAQTSTQLTLPPMPIIQETPQQPQQPQTPPPAPTQPALPSVPMITTPPAQQPQVQAPVQPAPQPMPMVTPPPPTPPPAPATPEEKLEEKNIYLNFENTDLINFIDYIAEVKKLNIIPDKTLEGSKISLTIREPLSVDGAWNIFLTVLEMAGFSIIETGPVFKIIPKDQKIQQPLPAFINVPYTTLPDSDLTIRYVIVLSNIQVGDIQPVLESMLSTPNSIHAQKDMNAFIITDKSYNVKAAAKLITELDQMGLPETVTVLRLKRANATDIKTLFDSLIRKSDSSQNAIARILGKAVEGNTEYFSPTTRIIPEERTNSLILMGTNDSVQKIIDFVTNNIDTELKAAESPLHVYELQYIDATQAASILKDVTTTQFDSTTGQAAAKYGSIRGGVKYFRDMKFQPDKTGNRLIVSCFDNQDWKLIKKMLDDLDKPQPQVGIETLFVTISDQDMKALGGMTRNKKHGQIGINVDAQSASMQSKPALQFDSSGATPLSLLGSILNQVSGAVGQSVLTFGQPPNAAGTGSNIWSVLTVLQTQTNASVLSQPFITVANKTKGTVTVGQTLNVVQDTVGGPNAVNGFAQITAALTLDVTPQINLDGLIQMQINFTNNQFTNASGTTQSNQVFATNASIADGQVLVLGGFVSTTVTEQVNKTPILGDIPFLGWFFKQKSRQITKLYYFVFLAPTIIKPRTLPGMQLYTKMKLHQATEDIEEAVQTKRTNDPVHNWFFNAEKENYSHKVIDFANARYQPTTVDIRHDPYYRSSIEPDAPVTYTEEILQENPAPTQQVQAEQQEQKPSVLLEEAKPVTSQEPLLPQTTQPPALPTQSPDDAQLEEKRQKLRELLAPETVTGNRPEPSIELPSEQLRTNLKNLLSIEEPAPQATNANMTVGYHQRNNLKQFLGAQNTNKKPLHTRKVSV